MNSLIDVIVPTKSKKIQIHINQNGEVVLKVPNNTDMEIAKKFVLTKKDWIVKHKNKILSRNLDFKEIIEYKKISLLGKLYTINFNEKYKNPCLTECEIIVKNYTKLVTYLKFTAQRIIVQRAQELAQIMNISNFEIKIDNAKSRWGVCNSNRQIKINFRLIMLPHAIIDYVLIHELSHLIEMNHSSSFWQIVEHYIPNYKILRKNLHEFEFLLPMYRKGNSGVA